MLNENPKMLQLAAVDFSIETLMVPLIEKSMQEGFNVNIVCKDTGRHDYLKSLGFNMHNVDIPRNLDLLKIMKATYAVYNHLKDEKYDIVHVHTPLASVIARIASKMARQKNVIYTAHGYYFHEGMKKSTYKLFFYIEKFSAKYLTDFLLLQSIEDYKLSIDHQFKSSDKIIHLGNGVDIWTKFNRDVYSNNELANLKKSLNIQDNFIYTFVGRLVSEKGIFELIESFKRLYKVDDSIRLLLVGDVNKSERDTNSYIQLQKELKHEGIIHAGYRKDVPQLMAISDVFILPSHREGLPRSIIEAMALKKPVIASNIRGCREEVMHGENGFLFEKKNIEELFRFMKEFVENPQKCIDFGNNGRIFVEKYFDEKVVLNKQIDLFNKILNEK